MNFMPLSKSFVDAGIELGLKNIDPNGKEQLGRCNGHTRALLRLVRPLNLLCH